MRLIPTPSVQSSFRIRYESIYQSIACVEAGQAWIKTGDRRLQLMNHHGDVKDTVEADYKFNDVVLLPQGELILTDTSNNGICSISHDKVVRTLFRTQWEPEGLCCLHSGDILVTFFRKGRVIIYSMSGKIIQELDKSLFKYPQRVTQNKVNSDLYIIDKDNNSYSTTGKVVALDTSYLLPYQYTGQGNAKFFPTDICTDSAGRVLITDLHRYSYKVHVLDKDGQFLQYILTEKQGLREPFSIHVDNIGNAWVGEGYGIVKLVKYLQ